MRIDGKSTRVRERIRLEIPLLVRYQESGVITWEEATLLRDVTPFGAGFFLKRPVEPKRLVHLTMPLPRQFRFYEHSLIDYRIWAVVRYIEANPPNHEQITTFSIGVASLGKRLPLA